MSEQSQITFNSEISIEKSVGPQLNSKDPAERKLARELRLKRRLEVLTHVNDSIETTEEDVNLIAAKKAQSDRILEKLIEEAKKDFTGILTNNKTHEVSRREQRDIETKKTIETLESDANDSEKAFNEIIERYSKLQNKTDPLDVHNSILNIKKRCDSLLADKDKIIHTLKTAIHKSERTFNSDQRNNQEDIEILFKRIDKHIAEMRVSFRKQLNIVKYCIKVTTQDYIKDRYSTWEDLYTQLMFNTEQLSDNKFRFLKKVGTLTENVIHEFEEEFRSQKAALLRTVNTSQQGLQNIKADIMTNSEKYKYNFQILEIRCNESTILVADQKRRSTKLQDTITNLKKRVKSFKTTTKNEIKKHLADIKKVQKQIVVIENKADFFAKNNEKVFFEMWDLNKNNCQKVLDDILAINDIIYQQQLAREFVSEKWTLPSFKSAVPSSPEVKQYLKPAQYTDVAYSSSTDLLKSNKTYKHLLKKILVLTSDKTGFLTEKRIKQLVSKYGTEDRGLVRLENIFNSLRILKDEDMDLMLNFFLPYAFCPACYGGELDRASITYNSEISNASFFSMAGNSGECSRGSILGLFEAIRCTTHTRESIEDAIVDIVTLNGFQQESEEFIDIAKADLTEMTEKKTSVKKKISLFNKNKMICQFNHSLVISSIYVIKALREFIEYYSRQSDQVIPTTRERMNKTRITSSRLIQEKDIIQYWTQVRDSYGENSSYFELWNRFVDGLRYYLDVLKYRKLLSEDVVKLRRENQRLKKMAESYKNHHTFLPPICEIQCICATVKSPTFKDQKKT